jgi:hypothetical protein
VSAPPKEIVAGLIVVATVALVIGTAIERNSEEMHQDEAGALVEPAGEVGEAHVEGEAGVEDERSGGEGEFRPFGLDIEAAPFVALAAIVSLGLAGAVWRRPDDIALLVVVAATMAAVAVLDVREVFHQGDEGNAGLAVLAGAVAVLHLAAAGFAVRMSRVARFADQAVAG